MIIEFYPNETITLIGAFIVMAILFYYTVKLILKSR